jgi:hypothetical protein
VSIVNRYQVDMRVSRGGKDPRIVTRIEPAYSVLDAIMQASVNHVAENPGEACEALVHIGPPADTAPAPQVAIAMALDPWLADAARDLAGKETSA